MMKKYFRSVDGRSAGEMYCRDGNGGFATAVSYLRAFTGDTHVSVCHRFFYIWITHYFGKP